MNTILRLIICAVLLPMLSACTNFLGMYRDQSAARGMVAELHGTLSSPACPQCEVIMVILGKDDKPLSYRVYENPGTFRIQVSTKARRILAFHDTNRNLALDAGEAFVVKTVSTAPDSMSSDELLFEILPARKVGPDADRPSVDFNDLRTRWMADIDTQMGAVIDLEDPRFDSANSIMGMWEPLKFMQSGYAGIYFLEPYSPRKIPVLFVHGIGGSPRNFAPLVARMNRERFQPWFLYYPSGVKIDSVGAGLIDVLNKLRHDARFADMHIVAHSMGGVVTRSFLSSCHLELECEFVRTFTSISSPFGGDPFARSGIDYSPVVMPVWHSLAEGSPFLRDLFAVPMPAGVRHYLLFGYRNTSMVFRNSSDGTISLESQLRREAQLQATDVKGFNENHFDILMNRDVSDYVNAVLSGVAVRH